MAASLLIPPPNILAPYEAQLLEIQLQFHARAATFRTANVSVTVIDNALQQYFSSAPPDVRDAARSYLISLMSLILAKPSVSVFGEMQFQRTVVAAQAQSTDTMQQETIMTQIARDSQKQMIERWKIMQETQTKIFEITQDVSVNKAKTADKAFKAMDGYIRG